MMFLYETNDPDLQFSFTEAVFLSEVNSKQEVPFGAYSHYTFICRISDHG